MSNHKPTHRASVNLGTQDKPRYREIGALWAHKDGKGFNFTFDLIPVNGGPVIFREIETKDEQAAEGDAR